MPLGYATQPPARTMSTHRSSTGPPASVKTASTPLDASDRSFSMALLARGSKTPSAPSRRTNAVASRPGAAANTRARRRFANCTASVRSAPDAPKINTVSPRRIRRWSSIPCSAVGPGTRAVPACSQSKASRYMRSIVGIRGHELGIEAAGIIDRLDTVAHSEPTHEPSFSNNYSGAISAENQRKLGTSVRSTRAVPPGCIPYAHACRLNGDEHFLRPGLWYGGVCGVSEPAVDQSGRLLQPS
jgi:hypothetical protein